MGTDRPTLAANRFEQEWEQARAYLDLAQVILLVIDDRESVRLINRHGAKVLGPAAAEIVGRNWFEDFVPAPARDAARQSYRELLQREPTEPVLHENLVLTATGDERLIAWHSGVLKNSTGQTVSVITAGHDVTDRRRAELQIQQDQQQLRALALEVVVAEERQRRRIAEALHDSLSQTLHLLKMKISRLEKAGDVVGLVDEAVQTAKSLSFELSPPVLYDLGLEAALQWLADDVRERYGLTIELHGGGPVPQLDERLSIVLFRAVRELLINVARHSQARRASVGLAERQGHVWVTVEDNGAGFGPDFDLDTLVPGREGIGFGLFSIRQRLIQLGGCMDISSAPGSTLVTLVVPLHPASREEGDAHPAG